MDFDTLPKSESMPLMLRELYERYGYRRYRMGSFEPYDMYMENRQFLKSEGIITLTDAAGRLMALKPDVTMSLAKNAGAKNGRYYYNENVFRIERGGEEYREINQMGVEYFGADEGYAQAEVVTLAVETLNIAGGKFVLDLSHMGFISGLLSALGLENSAGKRTLEALKSKSAGALEAIADTAGLSRPEREILFSASSLRDTLRHGVEHARSISISPEMLNAVEELDILAETLSAAGELDGIYLDFSVINDIDYYNGLVFRGYVKGVPRAALAGGRYDSLMNRFGFHQKAVGFALYLSELDRLLYNRTAANDVLLIYGDTKPPVIAEAVRELAKGSVSVRAERFTPDSHSAKQVFILTDEGLSALEVGNA